jgi:hypothetical protein
MDKYPGRGGSTGTVMPFDCACDVTLQRGEIPTVADDVSLIRLGYSQFLGLE